MRATVNRLYEVEFVLTPKVNATTVPHTVYYEAHLTPTEAGSYEIVVSFHDETDAVAYASSGTITVDLLASTASVATSAVSGAGVDFAKTGTEAYFRVELNDKHGNYAGDGFYIYPIYALTLPIQHQLDDVLVPIILEARLVPHGPYIHLTHPTTFRVLVTSAPVSLI
mgnify:CR=1 FL=1